MRTLELKILRSALLCVLLLPAVACQSTAEREAENDAFKAWFEKSLPMIKDKISLQIFGRLQGIPGSVFYYNTITYNKAEIGEAAFFKGTLVGNTTASYCVAVYYSAEENMLTKAAEIFRSDRKHSFYVTVSKASGDNWTVSSNTNPKTGYDVCQPKNPKTFDELTKRVNSLGILKTLASSSSNKQNTEIVE
jgi:hypothetical protein